MLDKWIGQRENVQSDNSILEQKQKERKKVSIFFFFFVFGEKVFDNFIELFTQQKSKMDHSGGGFAASSWAAMLGHHGIATPADHHASFSAVAHAHNAAVAHHHGMPMDLHVPQAFPYYRYFRLDFYSFTWAQCAKSMSPHAVGYQFSHVKEQTTRKNGNCHTNSPDFEWPANNLTATIKENSIFLYFTLFSPCCNNRPLELRKAHTILEF